MSNKHVNVALVGCGGVANVHVESYQRIPEANLAAVCDINEKLGKEFQNKYRVEKFYSNYEDLLLDPSIELIDLCTPPTLHKEQIIMAFVRNKHVLVEKPPVLDMDEMDEVVKEYEKSSLKFCVIHNQRFEESIIYAKRRIDANEIGEVIGVDIFWQGELRYDHFARDQNHWCHNLTGGRWEELMPHYVYLARYFIGEMRLEKASICGNPPDYPWLISSDALILLSALHNSGFVNLRFTLRNDSKKQVLVTVYGTTGHMYIERGRRAMTTTINRIGFTRYKQKQSAIYCVRYRNRKRLENLIDKTRIRLGRQSAYFLRNRSGTTEQIRQYVQAILLDRPPPVPIEEAYAVMKLTREIGDTLGNEARKSI
jgi:predicted dehydrogenase